VRGRPKPVPIKVRLVDSKFPNAFLPHLFFCVYGYPSSLDGMRVRKNLALTYQKKKKGE